jgi:uncharacterized membrane protein
LIKKGINISRLEAFSDAVFALSATLLVVSLEAPHNFSELVNNVYGFLAFGLSFTMLIFIWTQHSLFFRKFQLNDPVTILLNSILLFVILFYVYPLKYITNGLVSGFITNNTTTLISTKEELQYLFVIYGVGFIAVFSSFLLLYKHALKRKTELQLSKIDEFDIITFIQFYSVFVFVGILSIIFTLFDAGVAIGLPGWIYGLLGILLYLNGRRRNSKKKKLGLTEK